MNDLVILGISTSGVVILSGLILFLITERQAGKRALELKMFQMENTRIIQSLNKSTDELAKTSAQRHEENMAYFHGMMQSMARMIRKQEEGEGPKA